MPDICSGSLNAFWASSSDFCHRGLRAQGIEAAGRLLAHISGVAGALGHDVNGSCQWMGLTRLQSVALAACASLQNPAINIQASVLTVPQGSDCSIV